MEDIKEIVSKIEGIDAELSKSKKENYSERIDLNDPNWQKRVQELENAFLFEHKASVYDLTADLIDIFVASDRQQRLTLWEALFSTNYLKRYIEVDRGEEGSVSWFKDELVLLIIKDLGEDSRDALLELNYVIDRAKAHSVEVNPIITEFSQLANAEDHHGMGSMKSILGRVLELNPTES